METLGILLILAGAWATYSGYKGIDPVKTGFQILTHANSAQAVLTDATTAAAAQFASVSFAAKANYPINSAGTQQAVTGNAGTVVAFARAQIGKPYVLGGVGPNVWDCSGLTMKAYALIGIKLLHSASAQVSRGTRIYKKSDLQAGDLLFPAHILGVASLGDHVQIYTGANTVVEAANPKTGVREISIDHWWPGEGVFAKRLIAAPSQNTAGNYYGAGSPAANSAPSKGLPNTYTPGSY